MIKFRRNKQGINLFKSTYTTENPNVVTTVEEDIVGFKSRKIDRSNSSSKIYSYLGLPIVKNFNHMVSTNMISNCPISVADIINYDK